jgi:hypothetical protein
MGNDMFRLSPSDSIREGQKQIAQAGDFIHQTNDLYNTVDSLLETGYTSPAAREIYAKIQLKRPVLDGVAKTLNNYGNYMINSGATTIRTDESIADGVKIQ